MKSTVREHRLAFLQLANGRIDRKLFPFAVACWWDKGHITNGTKEIQSPDSQHDNWKCIHSSGLLDWFAPYLKFLLMYFSSCAADFTPKCSLE